MTAATIATAAAFHEVPIDVARARLADRLADYPWCLGVHDESMVVGLVPDVDPRNCTPIPVLVVRVRSRWDARRPEIPLVFPDAATGYPVLVRVGGKKAGGGGEGTDGVVGTVGTVDGTGVVAASASQAGRAR